MMQKDGVPRVMSYVNKKLVTSLVAKDILRFVGVREFIFLRGG